MRLQFCLGVYGRLVDIIHYAFIFQWMVATDGLYILKHRCIWVRVPDWLISYIRAIFHIFGTPFSDIWQYLWYPGTFHAFRIGCSAKTFNRWLQSNFCAVWLSNLIPLYCNLYNSNMVTIFNRWLCSKDMKPQTLAKEALVVFHLKLVSLPHFQHDFEKNHFSSINLNAFHLAI